MSNIIANSVILSLSLVVGFAHASDLNVGVIVAGEIKPGVYGRVEIGNALPPPLLYSQPVVIMRPDARLAPLYLHVPPGHAKKWSKHCHKYHACNRPVYFVRSEEYEPHYKRRKKHKRDD